MGIASSASGPSSELPTFDNAFSGSLTGWPTPNATEFGHTNLEGLEARRSRYAEKYGNNGFGLTLGQAVPLWLAGWPTPMAGSPATETYNAAGNNDYSRRVEELAGWPTCRANDGTGAQECPNRTGGPSLKQTAQLTGWPTCTTNDAKNAPYQTSGGRRFDTLPGAALKAEPCLPLDGWATPTAHERTHTPRDVHHGAQLANQAATATSPALTGWATPTVMDSENRNTPEQWYARQARNPGMSGSSSPTDLSVLAQMVPGPTSSSSPAPTASRGVLNPAHSRFLMGCPAGGVTPGWDTCSPGWENWDLMQRLLAECSPTPGATAPGG